MILKMLFIDSILNFLLKRFNSNTFQYGTFKHFRFLFLDKPGKPGIPQYGDIKDGKIPVTWSAPLSDGGAPITNYVLEFRTQGQFTWKRVTEKTIEQLMFVAKGLKVEEEYEFRVAAENKAGVGPYSESSLPVKAKEPIGRWLSG